MSIWLDEHEEQSNVSGPSASPAIAQEVVDGSFRGEKREEIEEQFHQN